MPKYLTELTGTFFFVLTFGLTGVGEVGIAPFVVGGTYVALVYMGGGISGGHFNPAISFATFVQARMDAVEFVKYAVFQLAGAILAGLATIWLGGHALPIAPGIGVMWSQALGAEFLFTALLVLLFLVTTREVDTAGSVRHGLAVGFAVMAGLAASDGISGGVLNPAVALGSAIADTITGGSSISDVWLYLVGPFAGGLLAVFASRNLSA